MEDEATKNIYKTKYFSLLILCLMFLHKLFDNLTIFLFIPHNFSKLPANSNNLIIFGVKWLFYSSICLRVKNGWLKGV